MMIKFKDVNGFPDLGNREKIPTDLFLAASKEIVSMIETFGRLFSPVVSDMSGNIVALEECYKQDVEKHSYLQDLVITNKHVSSALLWLKRALDLIAAFFHHIVDDRAATTDDLTQYLSIAYETTLKPYHGWVTRTAFSVIYRWTPKRSELIGTGPSHDENIKIIAVILPKMQKHLVLVDAFLKKHNLDDNKVA